MAINIDDFIAAQQQAKSYLSRFEAAVSEFKQTGNWMGEFHGVSINPDRPPKNLTGESINALDERSRSSLGEASLSSRRSQLSANVERAAFRAERKGMRIAQNTTDVEDFTEEEWARLKSRSDELYKLKASDEAAYNALFKQYDTPIPGTDDSVRYLTHSGAPELLGGALDPSHTVELPGEVHGNTKNANIMMSKELIQIDRENAAHLERLQSAQEEFSKTGKISGELSHFTYDSSRGIDPATGQYYPRSSDEVSQMLNSSISEAQGSARRYGTLLGLSGGEEGRFISAAPVSKGVNLGYFGQSASNALKSTDEVGGILESTGGRGTAYLMRGTDLNASSLLGVENYEIGLAGKNVPIAGLSSKAATHGSRVAGERYADEIFPAWALEQLEKDSARVASGEIPLRQVYGEETSKLLGIGEGSADVIAPKDVTPPKAFITPELEQAKSYLARFESTVSEFKETGNWMGEKYGVAFSDSGVPANRTKEAISQFEVGEPGFTEKQFGEERINARIEQLREDVGKAGFRAERKGMRVAQNITDVEDYTQEEWEALVRRNQELIEMGPVERGKLFMGFEGTIPGTADEKIAYAIHAGAPELHGGKLDPNFVQGANSEAGGKAGGNTKSANANHIRNAEDKLRHYESPANTSDVNKVGREIRIGQLKRQLRVVEEGGGFLSAGSPAGGMPGVYFGRHDWGTAAKAKVATESAELATDLGSSTGGRGSLYLMRGVDEFTVSRSKFIGGDGLETPILGAHKPIAGLSSRVQDLGKTSGGGFGILVTESGVPTIETRLKRGLENPSQRLASDVEFAWMEKTIKEDSARVAAGQVPIREIYGDQAYKVAFGAEEDTAAIAARVSSRTIPETIEEGLEKVVQRSGASSKLLGAATEASAAVAGGMNNSGALRGAGTALTVLRGLT
jgi:hypothetical protein